MKTLEKIFKNNKELLENESVKELIKLSQEKYSKLYDSYNELNEKENKILHSCMYSEVILKEGRNSKETVKEILKILNK